MGPRLNCFINEIVKGKKISDVVKHVLLVDEEEVKKHY